MKKTIKAWAQVSQRNALVGGGDKIYGYTPLCIYSTRRGAKENISKTRPTDKVIPVKIIFYEKN